MSIKPTLHPLLSKPNASNMGLIIVLRYGNINRKRHAKSQFYLEISEFPMKVPQHKYLLLNTTLWDPSSLYFSHCHIFATNFESTRSIIFHHHNAWLSRQSFRLFLHKWGRKKPAKSWRVHLSQELQGRLYQLSGCEPRRRVGISPTMDGREKTSSKWQKLKDLSIRVRSVHIVHIAPRWLTFGCSRCPNRWRS